MNIETKGNGTRISPHQIMLEADGRISVNQRRARRLAVGERRFMRGMLGRQPQPNVIIPPKPK
ncbi:MAG: hypothetical protein HY425_01895 [Candidatus Levybacteria bacterium]|nr:hypothetical protein [Candidatus Levybacteria bacterium]